MMELQTSHVSTSTVPQQRGDRRFSHVLLTRFNLRIAYSDIDVNDPDWLRIRFELFERFCLPSVMRQTEKSFLWLVFFDIELPVEFREKIVHLQQCGILIPVYLDEYRLDLVSEAVRSALPESCQFVITSRVDNDDALTRDFVARIQAAFADGERRFLNLPHGFQYATGKLYACCCTSNPFVSLVEPTAGMQTVWAFKHQEISRSERLRQLDSQPAFVQVIHGGNVSNTVTNPNSRVPLILAMRGFPLFRAAIKDRGLTAIMEECFFTVSWGLRRLVSRFRPTRVAKS